MLARLGPLVVVVALLGCDGGDGAPDAAACAVDEAPAVALATCGAPLPQCCGLPWCGPDVPDDAWFCATHSGANWCCACADPDGTGTPTWGLWKMECGLLGPADGGID
jgi:hypothetical protein